MRQVAAAVVNETGVYIHFAHIVDDDSDPQPLTVVEDVTEERRLAGAEEAGQHCYRAPLNPVHRHSLRAVGRSAFAAASMCVVLASFENRSISFASSGELRAE